MSSNRGFETILIVLVVSLASYCVFLTKKVNKLQLFVIEEVENRQQLDGKILDLIEELNKVQKEQSKIDDFLIESLRNSK